MSNTRILKTGLSLNDAVADSYTYTQGYGVRIAVLPPFFNEGYSVIAVSDMPAPQPVAPVAAPPQTRKNPCYCDSAYHRDGC